mgnify:CR=1 FL=1
MRVIWAMARVVILELIRRKDFYVLFTLAAVLTLLAGSVNIFNDRQIARYVVEINYLLVMISSLVIAVTTTARQIPNEFEQRTLLSLLAKPVSKGQVLAGKYLGAWVACGLCLVVFYVFMMLLTYTKQHGLGVPLLFQAAWLHWVMLGVVIGLALAGSLVFAAPSSNATICLVVVVGWLGVGRYLDKLAFGTAEPLQSVLLALYYLLPHLEFFDLRELLIHHWPPVKWGAVAIATLYGWFYMALLYALSCWLFQRKRMH